MLDTTSADEAAKPYGPFDSYDPLETQRASQNQSCTVVEGDATVDRNSTLTGSWSGISIRQVGQPDGTSASSDASYSSTDINSLRFFANYSDGQTDSSREKQLFPSRISMPIQGGGSSFVKAKSRIKRVSAPALSWMKLLKLGILGYFASYDGAAMSRGAGYFGQRDLLLPMADAQILNRGEQMVDDNSYAREVVSNVIAEQSLNYSGGGVILSRDTYFDIKRIEYNLVKLQMFRKRLEQKVDSKTISSYFDLIKERSKYLDLAEQAYKDGLTSSFNEDNGFKKLFQELGETYELVFAHSLSIIDSRNIGNKNIFSLYEQQLQLRDNAISSRKNAIYAYSNKNFLQSDLETRLANGYDLAALILSERIVHKSLAFPGPLLASIEQEKKMMHRFFHLMKESIRNNQNGKIKESLQQSNLADNYKEWAGYLFWIENIASRRPNLETASFYRKRLIWFEKITKISEGFLHYLEKNEGYDNNVDQALEEYSQGLFPLYQAIVNKLSELQFKEVFDLKNLGSLDQTGEEHKDMMVEQFGVPAFELPWILKVRAQFYNGLMDFFGLTPLIGKLPTVQQHTNPLDRPWKEDAPLREELLDLEYQAASAEANAPHFQKSGGSQGGKSEGEL